MSLESKHLKAQPKFKACASEEWAEYNRFLDRALLTYARHVKAQGDEPFDWNAYDAQWREFYKHHGGYSLREAVISRFSSDFLLDQRNSVFYNDYFASPILNEDGSFAEGGLDHVITFGIYTKPLEPLTEIQVCAQKVQEALERRRSGNAASKRPPRLVGTMH